MDMKLFMTFSSLLPAFAIALMILSMPIYGQINTPCTSSMISSLSPCMNFITNSSSNGTSPTTDCCSSLRSLTRNGTDCFCLVVTGSVPFQLPINRTLAISLPRACNMPGVPLQCKATTGAPLPAPGPASFGPTLSPRVAPASPSPAASSIPGSTSPALAPQSDTTPVLTPAASPTVDSENPAVLTPSATMPTYSLSPSLLLFALGIIVIKYYH